MNIYSSQPHTIASPTLSELDFPHDGSPSALNPFQSAEFGLDFSFAKAFAELTGIDLGEGVTVVHFDEGWQYDHPFFDSYLSNLRPFEQLGTTALQHGRAGHGTSVLGLHTGGFDGVHGLSPLLPGARIVLASALEYAGETSTDMLFDAIDLLADARAGVLLIARDWSSRAAHLPYELRSGVAELFERAARYGIVVVQAAGNGGLCLDNLVQRDGPNVRGQITMRADSWIDETDRIDPAFRIDTGSLIVGASTATRPFTRWTGGFALNPQPKSNYGRRVDCCAPGEHLFTATASDYGGLPGYTTDFGGTSGAAAIVAAAVASVQSLVLRVTGAPLSARAVRSLFRDAELGSPTINQDEPIGAVPNIRLILEKVLGNQLAR